MEPCLWSRRRRTLRAKRTFTSQNRAAFLFLAPSVAGTVVFTLIPFGAVIAEAFTGMADGTFAGLENFILVVHNAAFRLAAKNTLRFMAVCIPLLMAVSLWTAVLVKTAADRSGVFKTTMLLPMAVPVASVVCLWKVMFHPQGLLNQLLGNTGGAGIDFMRRKSAFLVLVFTTWCCGWPVWTESQGNFTRRPRWTEPGPGRNSATLRRRG